MRSLADPELETVGLHRLPPSGEGPLYRDVKRELLRLVEAGLYAPGETLPSEGVIAHTMGVSIGTLRKAVDELVHESVLVRRQGKGTFVALHNPDRFLFQFFHVESRREFPLADDAREREYPQVQCMRFERARPEENEIAALRLKHGDPVFRIDNRLSLEGSPVVHDRIAISAAMFKGLSEKRFVERAGTIYSLYQTEFGITVLRARERARATLTTRETGRVLGLAPGLPVLEVHRIAITFGGRPVEYRISTINTSRHDYVHVLSQAQEV